MSRPTLQLALPLAAPAIAADKPPVAVEQPPAPHIPVYGGVRRLSAGADERRVADFSNRLANAFASRDQTNESGSSHGWRPVKVDERVERLRALFPAANVYHYDEERGGHVYHIHRAELELFLSLRWVSLLWIWQGDGWMGGEPLPHAILASCEVELWAALERVWLERYGRPLHDALGVRLPSICAVAAVGGCE